MTPTDDGPGCGHDLCAFESLCLVVQADLELFHAQVDRLDRRDMGQALAHALDLGADEGQLLEVIAYSPDLQVRIAAGQLIVGAVERRARRAA